MSQNLLRIILVPLKKVSFTESEIETIDQLPNHFIEKVKFFNGILMQFLVPRITRKVIFFFS